MRRFLSRFALAIALGFLGTGCAPDSTTPTAPAVSFDRGGIPRNDDERDEHDDRAVSYAVIGDAPYGTQALTDFPRLIAGINADPAVRLVIHVGDVKGGSDLCTDAWFASVAAGFATFSDPLVFTPGDNDWTDCWPLKARQVDPLELLAKVRSMFFPDGRSLGQRPMAVRNQSADPNFAKFRENLRWSTGGVTFVTLHIVGSNDNLGRTPQMDAEHRERKSANLAWMRQAFAEAKAEASLGLVILTQANPGFENFWPPAAKTRYFIPFIARGQPLPSPNTAYKDYVVALAEELENFDKPVAYVHGDTHLFRSDKPLYSGKTSRVFENFTRIETFGWPDSHWVRIEVDPADSQLFVVKPQIVPQNAASSRAR